MKVRALTLAVLASMSASAIAADTIDPLKKAFIDDAEIKLQFRLRYEQADVENVDDQHQTTLRTRLNYKTGDIYNFFALTEVDDVRSTDNESLIADYRWDDPDYMEQQLKHLKQGYNYVSKRAAERTHRR